MTEYTQSDSLRKHMRAVEACMRAYARKFGEDEEKWGITGLLQGLRQAGIRFRDLETSQSSLEDIFVDVLRQR